MQTVLIVVIVVVLVLAAGLVLGGFKIRSLNIGAELLSERLDEVIASIDESRMTAIETSVKELSEAHADDVKDIGQRITDLNDRIELMRRKASARSGGGSFETMRHRAESASAKHDEMSRSDLLALAEG